MRKIHRKDNKRNKIIIISVLFISLISLTVGYSAFQTNLSINTKGNLRHKTWDFDYTGLEQTFTAPYDGTYIIELWGAQGGTSKLHLKSGFGGFVKGNIKLNKSTIFYIYVGEHKNTTEQSSFNGSEGSTDGGGPGGGATDIRLLKGDWNNFNSLKSRIMIAAGGGAGGTGNSNDTFGFAGGLIGYTPVGEYGSSATGGTQTKPGNDTLNTWHSNGYFGKGSKLGASGGGYYGGAGGAHSFGGGAGGSSFISGHNGCVAITESSTESNIIQRNDSNGNTCQDGTTDITCSYHYSNYIFTDTEMIDGKGYKWTTEKEAYVGQPQPDGTITTGHTGNGYARITYLGNNKTTN